MEHNIIVISSYGEFIVSGKSSQTMNSKGFYFLKNKISGFNLQSSKIFMNENEYRDILEWAKNET